MACKNDTVVSEITGKVYYDCGRSPYGFAEVALKTEPSGSFGDPIILGGAVANAGGQFSFNYELDDEESGNASLILVQESGFRTLLTEIKLKEDLYEEFVLSSSASATINLSGTRVFTATDTLYFSSNLSAKKSFVVQPSSGIIGNFNFDINQTSQTNIDLRFIYGIGLSDFNLAKTGLGNDNPSHNKIIVSLNRCETTAIGLVIN